MTASNEPPAAPLRTTVATPEARTTAPLAARPTLVARPSGATTRVAAMSIMNPFSTMKPTLRAVGRTPRAIATRNSTPDVAQADWPNDSGVRSATADSHTSKGDTPRSATIRRATPAPIMAEAGKSHSTCCDAGGRR